VQTPKLDGFEVLGLLAPEIAVIFTTAFDEYAVRAFEVHAVDCSYRSDDGAARRHTRRFFSVPARKCSLPRMAHRREESPRRLGLTNRRRLLVASFSYALSACAAHAVVAPQHARAASVSAPDAANTEPPFSPEPALLPFRAGAALPREVPGKLELQAVARGSADGFDLFEFAAPESYGTEAEVSLTEPGLPYAFMQGTDDDGKTLQYPNRIWIRLPSSFKAASLDGDLFTPGGRRGGSHAHFRINLAAIKRDPKQKSSPTFAARFQEALADYFARHPGPFFAYANGALRDRAREHAQVTKMVWDEARRANPKHPHVDPPQWTGDWHDFLAFRSEGRSALTWLEGDRDLYDALSTEARSVPITQSNVPRMGFAHWSALRTALPHSAPAEPLARIAPADFYYVRSHDLATLLDVTGAAETWGTRAWDYFDGSHEDRKLGARYETELALTHDALSQAFGPAVISDVALVGSDPYFSEGTDLTLIFKVRDDAHFASALSACSSTLASMHPGLTTRTFDHEGVTVTALGSSDGRVRQERASVDGWELISNSPGAIRRVISASHGKLARLADEPDFQYMLARDAQEPASLFAFSGERFIANVSSAPQQLKEAERVLAEAELAKPGFAALLFGFLNGRAPRDAAELVHAKLLTEAELEADSVGGPWQPGRTATGKLGTLTTLEPLIDEPDLERVSESEQAAFRFAGAPQLQPLALRASRTASAGLSLDLRTFSAVPVEYLQYARSIGEARVQPGALQAGLRLVFGVGPNAPLRRMVESEVKAFTDLSLTLDWLGDFAFLGLADRAELLQALLFDHKAYEAGLRARGQEDYSGGFAAVLEWAARLPAYAVFDVRSSAAATLGLAKLKSSLDADAPKQTIWEQVRKHSGVPVMVVRGADPNAGSLRVYYALLPHTLLVSFNEAVLSAVIDEVQGGTAPRAADPAQHEASQAVLDLAPKSGGAISNALAWYLSSVVLQADPAARAQASAVMRGAPEAAGDPDRVAALMRAYFGDVAVTPEGRRYTLGPDGPRDPLRGSPYAPSWPAIPVAGSPIADLLLRLRSLRAQFSIDDEPTPAGPESPRSLHVHLETHTN
jgi:hypothetical protein